MTDRDLLEAAAKAAGLRVKWMPAKPGVRAMFWQTNIGEWNPLTDDGDALRLAVKLRITPNIDTSMTEAEWAIPRFERGGFESEPHLADPYAATRRAIVRAAAAMVGQGCIGAA